jgi:hypothetical protein
MGALLGGAGASRGDNEETLCHVLAELGNMAKKCAAREKAPPGKIVFLLVFA